MSKYTLWAVACVAFLGSGRLALAQQPLLPLHTGDINNDGVRSVVDANCYAQAALADAYGNDAPCQAFPDADIDLQCNGAITITDVQRSILLVLYDLTGDPQLGQLLQLQDNDLDLVHDNCDPDDDNDGFLDDCETAEGTDPFDAASMPQCDDGNACTADTCPAGIGCAHTPVAGACDDGDPCTAGDTCAGGVCVPGAPACAPGFDAICSLSGPAGSVVACPLRVARDGQAEALPVALQVRLSWDSTLARPVNLYDLAPDGTVAAHLPADTLDTGHTVWMMPETLGSWNGDGALVVAHTADPTAALSAAWFDAATATVHGAPEVLWVDFELLAPLVAPASAPVSVSDAVAATAPAGDLPGRVIDGVIVVGPSCNAVAGLCDDGDACTLDLCDPSLGTCSHAAAPDGTPCDDGNACTAGDSCSGGSCSGDLAAGLAACDDGNVCTVDSCDPAVGCTHTPIDCNDGDPLTADVCDPAQGGCVHLDWADCTLGSDAATGLSYAVCPGPLDWAAARQFCLDRGGDLVSIHSVAEENALLAAMTVNAWIGANDQAVEGTWVWSDGTPMDFGHWRPGEPNDKGGEDCGELVWPYGGWKDTPCWLAIAFICER